MIFAQLPQLLFAFMILDKKFLYFSLQVTDELLVRLQSFSINQSYTTIPDSAKDGVPLFHLPQSSKTPVCLVQFFFDFYLLAVVFCILRFSPTLVLLIVYMST